MVDWRSTRNYLSVGNLGEHITARLLIDLDYHVLAGQDDLLGMVPAVLGIETRANPEDFIAVDPLGRLVTVNSKASIAPRACRILKTGNLSTPRLARGQGRPPYSALRAGLITPLEGESYSQVVKVDLMHLKAQVFEGGEAGGLSPIEPPHDVGQYIGEVLREFPGKLPPPRAWDLT
uniref:hypothetical protein n=1 Tax=Paenarthrobacter nicotinovorans TaxID=29320 RepID=UPI003F497F7B